MSNYKYNIDNFHKYIQVEIQRLEHKIRHLKDKIERAENNQTQKGLEEQLKETKKELYEIIRNNDNKLESVMNPTQIVVDKPIFSNIFDYKPKNNGGTHRKSHRKSRKKSRRKSRRH